MANRVLLEKEIKEYCSLNNIKDVPGFITQCLLQGFNVFRYGTTPQDNIKRERNEVEVNVSNREKKTNTSTVKTENKVEAKVTSKVVKRTIKIIDND